MEVNGSESHKALQGGSGPGQDCGAACLGRGQGQAAHRSPIQPALHRVHLPVTWLQACPSRQGGQRWPQPSP
jgi:hypothetical protein